MGCDTQQSAKYVLPLQSKSTLEIGKSMFCRNLCIRVDSSRPLYLYQTPEHNLLIRIRSILYFNQAVSNWFLTGWHSRPNFTRDKACRVLWWAKSYCDMFISQHFAINILYSSEIRGWWIRRTWNHNVKEFSLTSPLKHELQ
jgi:hypothetical protein